MDQKDKKPELKHCPFCGKGRSQVELYSDDDIYWKISCGACGSQSGINKDPKKVINHWNQRPHEEETD